MYLHHYDRRLCFKLVYLFHDILVKSFNFLSDSRDLEGELLHHDQDQGLDEHNVWKVLHEVGEHSPDACRVCGSVVNEPHG